MRGYVGGCREIPVEQIEVQYEGQGQLKGLKSVYLGLLDRKRRLQTSIAPAICDRIEEGAWALPGCEGVPTCIFGISKYHCAAYRELPPLRGRLTCYDPPVCQAASPTMCQAMSVALLHFCFSSADSLRSLDLCSPPYHH